MKKILVLTGDGKTLVYHRGELLKRFADAGLEVVGGASEELPHVRKFLASFGGRYQVLPISRSSLNPVDDWRMIRALWKWMREERPDYFFAYTIKSVCYGCLVAKMLGVPRIFALVPGLGFAFTPDGTWKQRLVHVMSRFLYSVALRCVNAVFLQNHDDERLLRETRVIPARVPIHVTMGSGVPLDEFPFRETRSGEQIRNEGMRFVLVTRLLRNKGVCEFAQAAERVRQRWPKAEFLLVGPPDPSPDGVPAGDVNDWHQRGVTRYEGERRDIANVLRSADVFVLPTFYREGVPRSTLEALSTGLPVITTDAVGSRETILDASSPGSEEKGIARGKNGWLVPVKDVPALVQACEAALERPEDLADMGRQSRRLAEQTFDVRRVNRLILDVMGLREGSDENREFCRAA